MKDFDEYLLEIIYEWFEYCMFSQLCEATEEERARMKDRIWQLAHDLSFMITDFDIDRLEEMTFKYIYG